MAQSIRNGNSASVPDPDSSISREDLFEMLGNDRRRQALEILMEQEKEVDVADLVEQVAAAEYQKPIDDLTRSERKTVYTAIVQRHLPKLEERGLVSHDPDAGEVSPSETLVDLNIYFEISNNGRAPFSLYYLALTVVGLGVVGLSALGVEPVATFGVVRWLSVFVGGLGLMAMVHLNEMRQMSVRSDGRDQSSTIPTPLSVLAAGIGALGGGLVGGAAMWGVLHHIMFFTPVITAVYGMESLDPAIFAHFAHSIAFAVLFVVLVRRTRLSRVTATVGETAIAGVYYGAILWLIGFGIVVPAISDVALATELTVGGVDILYLPFEGLAAHVLYGGLMGATYAYCYDQLSKKV